ncbi:putative metalloendopeptidase G1-type [Clarias magur]|uniref:Putative metalloendopeptidase G1-type n=1 Tax=Clarias magur TaxID=1594786 RepID=A0A8J4TIZ5_CLAMG|nr:putative metalloendopeptidase G1-type [Clarias magur]
MHPGLGPGTPSSATLPAVSTLPEWNFDKDGLKHRIQSLLDVKYRRTSLSGGVKMRPAMEFGE